MNDMPVTLTVEQAKRVLKSGQSVHCFMNPSASMLIGADWNLPEVYEFLDTASRIEIAGDAARHMKHGLVVFGPCPGIHCEPHFFETDAAALAAIEGEAFAATQEDGPQ